MILTFQKEFAKRLMTRKLNSINSLVGCFYNVKLNFHISKNCFRPVPKVESTVLTFKRKKKVLLNESEKKNEFSSE